MDKNLVLAIFTSVCTAGSTAGVAITALMVSNKRIDRVETAVDRVEAAVVRLTDSMDARFNSVDACLEMLTVAIHEIGKRLSILADRDGR